MLKRFVLMILMAGVAALSAACSGGIESGADGSGGGVDAVGDGGSAATAEAVESAPEPSALDGVDVSALLTKKLGDVIDILGSEHSEPYIVGYDTRIDYGDDCTIWYRAVIEKGGPALLDPKADISGIEVFCEKDVYKGISVGKSLDAINAGLISEGEREFGDGRESENQEGLSSAWNIVQNYDCNAVNVRLDYDENRICRSVFLEKLQFGAKGIKRNFGVDAAGDNEEYFVLNGVDDVSALLGKPLKDVIDLLGQEYSEPRFLEYGTAIIYMGSCRLSYYSEAIEAGNEARIEPDAEALRIEIVQEKDVYKGISVGKTLDEINSNPDLLNKVELNTDDTGEYMRDEYAYGMFSGGGLYTYGDSLNSIYMAFDDQLICVWISISESDLNPDSPWYKETMLL